MDDLYDDLDNYDEINLVEELKNENTLLKEKLNEYATKMEHLKRDLDHLSSEHNRILLNYSSLLLTSRAEIERKTQIINTLNKEKDMLIINSVNSSGRNILKKVNRERSNSRKSRRDEESPNMKPELKKKERLGPAKTERTQESRLPSSDTARSGNTEDSSKNDNNLGQYESNDREASKENVKSTSAQSLKHRRKSVLDIGKHKSKYSSEEEDSNYTREDNRNCQSRNDSHRKYMDKHRQNPQYSDSYGIDEKCYQESSKEKYYKKHSHNSYDQYKRKREASGPRYKRHSSVEKSRQAMYSNPEESYQRKDQIKYRVLESPPTDKPDPSRWVRERRSRYDAYDRDDYRDRSRRDKSHHRLKRRSKNRPISDYDEPRSKRARTRSCPRIIDEHPEALKDTQQSQVETYNSVAENKSVATTADNPGAALNPEATDTPILGEKAVTGTRDSFLETDVQKSKEINTHERRETVGVEDKSLLGCKESSTVKKMTSSAKLESPNRISDPPCKVPDTSAPEFNHLSDKETFSNEKLDHVVKRKVPVESNDKGDKKCLSSKCTDKVKDKPAPNCVNPDKKDKSTNEDKSTQVHKHKPTTDLDSKNTGQAIINQCQEPRPKSNQVEANEKLTFKLTLGCESKPNVVKDRLATEFAENSKHFGMSCQSPDNPPQEVSVQKAQPKEIRYTAIMKLDDPRLSNPKYVKKVEGNTVKLFSLTGNNAGMKVVNKSNWGINQPKKPEALNRPPQRGDDILCNVDNQVSNMSLESGEIYSDSNDTRMRDYVIKSFFQDYENERLNQENVKDIFEERRDVSQLINRDSNLNAEQKLPPVKYKLPKPAQPIDEKPSPLGMLLGLLPTTPVAESQKATNTKLDVDVTYGKSPVKEKAKDKTDKPRPIRRIRPITLSKTTIERDLELSDETCDNIFVKKRTKDKKQKDSTINKNRKEKVGPPIPKEVESKTEEIKNRNDKLSKPEEPDVSSVKKTRKKPEKAKSIRRKDNDKDTLDKGKSKSKDKTVEETKDHHKDKKAKFSDLFGDSCSLITPEDLGVPEVRIQAESAKAYVPIFEDAQDAVDLDIGAKKIKEIQKSVHDFSLTNRSGESGLEIDKAKESKSDGVKDVKKSESNVVVNIPIGKVTPNMEVSNVAVTKEPDVVKTIIISSGVQSVIKESDDISTNQEIEKLATKTEEHKVQIPIALATSTPYKRLLEMELQSCNTSDEGNKNDETSSVNQSSMSNTEAQNEDAPDVRIFVRRRRKIKK